MQIKFRNFFKKSLEVSRNFLIFVPDKYRNSLCKHFTTNSTSFWN